MPAQTVIKLRRSTTSEWEAAQAAAGTTPILSFGEPGFDTTVNKIKIGNGTDTWEELSYASGGGITVAETAPFSPQQGDLWFNSDNAVTYIYYDSYWVDLIPAIAGPAGADGPAGANGAGYLGVTSTTSTTIGNGSTTFATPSTGAFTIGTRVRVASTASPQNWEEGVITALVANTSITVNVDLIGGSGTFANWTFSVAGSSANAEELFVRVLMGSV